MKIEKLFLENFRNYKTAEVSFADGQNLIFGENAQGKTNLLEAIFYLSCLKNFHSSRDFDAVRLGEREARLCGEFEAYGRNIDIDLRIRNGSRRLLVNGIEEKRPSNHIGLIKTVVFSPDDLKLIKDGPALRRRFLNIAISQMRPQYIKALAEHNKIIENKKQILKMEEGREKYLDFLDVLDEKLAEVYAYIIRERGEFLKKSAEIISRVGEEISSGKEKFTLSYSHASSVEDTNDTTNAERLREHLKSRRSAELSSFSCLIGAHRDDFVTEINGKSAREFASQGQVRSLVLALKVAEHEILEKDSGERPILLLDDVLSELDVSRRAFLINDVNRGQTIITGCDESMFCELLHGKIFTVSKGEIIAEDSK